jgi:hypothetical protein
VIAFLLAATAPQGAVAAERAFAAMAQAQGQWTAFRHYAAPGGTMFVPEPVKAQAWLKGRKDPPASIRWSPTASFVSCDGNLAVNTGEWRSGPGAGYFSTVWQRKPDGGWHWLYDGGADLAAPRAAVAQPVVRTADCGTRPAAAPMMRSRRAPDFRERGSSTDGTLAYEWQGERGRGHSLSVWLWTGKAWAEVIHDSVAPPAS